MTSSSSDPESGASRAQKPTVRTPLIQRGRSVSPSQRPNRLKTILLCAISLTLGLIQTIPLAILVPESLNLKLSTTQSMFIVAAWPASSLLVLLIQPAMNRLNTTIYLLCTGLINSAAFSSFYFSVTVPHYYFYLAVLARFVCGATLFLINNKTAVGITDHLRGNVSISSTLWEVFNSAGQASGAYLGAWLDDKFGFAHSMAVSGSAMLVVVVILSCCYPRPYGEVAENPSMSTSIRDMYRLYLSRDMIVYCWCPMVCIGGCMVYGEGILTQFYRTKFCKSLQYGGFLLGMGGLVYFLSALVLGILRERWSCLTISGLVLGLVGCGVCLPLMGPWPLLQLPDQYKLPLSIASFICLLVCSCAIQLNSLTMSAESLTHILDSQQSMSVALNSVNVAYNLGAFVGPITGGALLSAGFSFGEVFAMGAPFFVLAALLVGIFHISHNRS